MKRVISLILCLVLVLGMAATAAAAEDDTITTQVTNASGRTYKAYRIFTGELVNGTTLTFTGWDEDDVDGTALLSELKDANSTYASLFAHCNTAGEVASVLLQYPDNHQVARHFANVAAKHVKETGGIEIAADEVTVELNHGYYLMLDQTKSVEGEDPDNFVANAALLQVTDKAPITLSMKVEAPTHEKNIITLDDQGNHNHTTVEDYAIGDTVEFHLRAELPPNVQDFDSYRLVFHDVMSDGLAFVNKEAAEEAPYSIQVNYQHYNEQTQKTEPTTLTLTEGTDYTVEIPATCETGKACDVHFVIENVFDFISRSEAGDAVFIVTYQAVLTDEAEIGTANTNDYALEFSNDPNWNGEPGDDEEPTGITPWDQVEVYTTEITINKIDGLTNKALAGAEFTLTGEKINRVKTTGVWFEPYTDANYAENNKYWLLNDGTYTTLDPNAEGVDTTKYTDTTIVYKKVEKTQVIETAEDVAIKGYVNESGVLTFAGLEEGTYTLTESVVPTGYNAIEPVNVTILFDEKTSTYTYQWDGGTFHNNDTVTIANYSGSKLPETGGIGTTLFYIIGGLLVAGSAVLLVTRKRMSAE